MITWWQTPSIDVSSIKPSKLTNTGLLIASLSSDGREVVDVNMVVQVTRDGDEFTRVIYSPLE